MLKQLILEHKSDQCWSANRRLLNQFPWLSFTLHSYISCKRSFTQCNGPLSSKLFPALSFLFSPRIICLVPFHIRHHRMQITILINTVSCCTLHVTTGSHNGPMQLYRYEEKLQLCQYKIYKIITEDFKTQH